MIVLGINPGIDSAAALVVDGRIGAVVEEERLSRVKMHLGFPRRAIQAVIQLSNIEPKDVDCVTFSFVDYLNAHPVITRFLLQENGCPVDPENPIRPVRLLESVVKTATIRDIFPVSARITAADNYSRNHRSYMHELHRLGINVKCILPIDHHTSHAASAYYFSGFDECLIVTADGCGDGCSLTVNIGKCGKIKRIREIPEVPSAGLFYASITAFLGFRAHRHEGKITGLAAYGDPGKCYDYFVPCLGLSDDKLSLTCGLLNGSSSAGVTRVRRLFRKRYFRHASMNAYDEYFWAHLRSFSREDIAAAAQRRLEDVFIGYLQPVIRETRLQKLALAGGVFGNVKLNQKLFELDGVKEIFIQPNMGDGGNALGGAFLAWVKQAAGAENLCVSRYRMNDVYLGPEFSSVEIEDELKRRGLRYRHCEDIEAAIAEKLAKHEVVGRFNGRMEYGPRALGNRSILANPTDARINAVLNKRLHRTEFMPFAPSVLEEDAQVYFEINNGNRHAAEFMTITCGVRPEKRDLIPAVCHVDGTARPHVVREEVNPSFHRILREFKQRTGLGVIINTSFNIHEEPIVCTPADACIAFEQNSVDALAIGNFMVG